MPIYEMIYKFQYRRVEYKDNAIYLYLEHMNKYLWFHLYKCFVSLTIGCNQHSYEFIQ